MVRVSNLVLPTKKDGNAEFAVSETLTSKILNSLTDSKVEDVICASSLCASE